jgi:hypothetical protein
MKYLLVEPKLTSVANNIALMKWARWCEINGHEYQYIRGCVKPKFTPDKILMSCIFSYYSKKYEKTIDYYLKLFPNVKILVGGVFPTLSPEWFNKEKWNGGNPFFKMEKRVDIYCGLNPDIEELPPKYNVDISYEESDNKSIKLEKKTIVLYSSRGCVNKCGYCAVPRLEGDMRSFKSISHILDVARIEMPDAKSVVLYDNNFTAHKYWNNICDELIEFGLPVDIHGLHVDSFTPEMAKKFSQMTWGSQGKAHSTAYLRFSFDKMKYKDNIGRALTYYMDAGLNKRVGFFLYMLFNYIDSPHDFWSRLVYTQKYSTDFGTYIMMFPQRYEPFQALEKYKFVGKKWTPELAAGLRKLSTFLHGFLTLSPNRNLFRWIGYSEEEFLDKVYKFATVKGYRLEKNEKDEPPTVDDLMKTI